MTKTSYTLSTQAAAAMLAAQAGGSQEQWETRLRNWRKPDRTPPLSWSVDTPRPKYDPQEVAAFIEALQQEAGALALRHADPTEELPKAEAAHVRNNDARHLIQVSWTDQNTSGVLVLAVWAAKSLIGSLTHAVASAEADVQKEFDTSMNVDMQAMELRSQAAGPDGELPSLAEARRRLAD